MARDPCSALYHELVHAFDIAQGADVSAPCAKIKQDDKTTPPSVGDVRAIRAENAVRRALGQDAVGKRPRTNHGVDARGRVERLPGRQPPAAGKKSGDAWDSDEVRKDCEVPEPQPPPGGPHSEHETAGGTDGQALAAGRPLPAPAPDAPGPFSLADPERARTVLGAAGFVDIQLEPHSEAMWFGDDADDAQRFVLGQLGWMHDGLDDEDRRRAVDNLRAALNAHDTGHGVLYESATWTIRATRP